MRIAIYGGSFNPPIGHTQWSLAGFSSPVRPTRSGLFLVFRHAFEASNDKVLRPSRIECDGVGRLRLHLGTQFGSAMSSSTRRTVIHD